MRKVIMIGCDLHEESMILKIAEDRQTPETQTVKNTVSGRAAMIADLRRRVKAADGTRVIFAYEASGQGFGLHDQLAAAGDSHVASGRGRTGFRCLSNRSDGLIFGKPNQFP